MDHNNNNNNKNQHTMQPTNKQTIAAAVTTTNNSQHQQKQPTTTTDNNQQPQQQQQQTNKIRFVDEPYVPLALQGAVRRPGVASPTLQRGSGAGHYFLFRNHVLVPYPCNVFMLNILSWCDAVLLASVGCLGLSYRASH